jgi:uncharacterized membrane protein HdeD (DUF308 family)
MNLLVENSTEYVESFKVAMLLLIAMPATISIAIRGLVNRFVTNDSFGENIISSVVSVIFGTILLTGSVILIAAVPILNIIINIVF